MNVKKKTKLMLAISFMAVILLSAGLATGVYAADKAYNVKKGAGTYIGVDAAKAAALAHAGVKESDTRYCNSWLEYKDRHPAYYEVEFEAGGIEYEYDIDMYSGAVIKYDTEYRNYSYVQSAGGSGTSGAAADIGQNAAKAAALAHAGVKESDTSYCSSLLEYENRIPVYYEVEFVTDNIKYEYEIDMYSGTVIKCDTKYHDYSYINAAGNGTNPGSSAADGASDIGQNAAKQAALSHAGLSESQVYHLKIEQDYDGVWREYEVEFKYNGVEYEYDIDAATGNILKYDCDGADFSAGTGSSAAGTGNSTAGTVNDIGQNAAKQAALSHAGLSESQVYHMKIEKDYDDGRTEYEVKFKYNRMEYEYDIDAATGNILKYECDND